MKARKLDLDRMRELCAKGLNAVQIGARLGVSPNAIYYACKKLGISVAAAHPGKTDISFVSRA